MGDKDTTQATRSTNTPWLRYTVLALVGEKIIQHIVVTIAFALNLKDIAATVVIDPTVLMVSGAGVAVLFGLSLWGLLAQKRWALGLVIALAVFDIVGEFVAQGRIAIAITVSFLVATLLLILALAYRSRLGYASH
jgi:hypothetical protein